MRPVFLCLAICLHGSLCFGQNDSLKTTQPPVQKQVFIPGVDTPVSGPGMTAQVPANAAPSVQNGTKKRKTAPPSDPRGFGISIPLGKTKKDSLR